ncbi:hypothetical protein N7535_008229 [Penicillium sp. DV-2018c]|nr:hypothetical protein N7461_004267 [Penicillium sp. DV-2018c]KAJ5566591.1 hypothetical protein N7535_008229 [Penicillium sp. DV-2018c]
MAQPSGRMQYERVLRALRRQIICLRYNPEKHHLVIGRLQALSRISRFRTQIRNNTRLRHLSDILQSFLPAQISLLKADRGNGPIVAEALARMVLEFCALPDVAFDDEDYVGTDEESSPPGEGQHIRRRVDLEDDSDGSEMDPSDDNYIARVLLGPTWNDPVVDIEIIIDL